MIFVSTVLEEHLPFRRGVGFDWSAWDDAAKLPIGLAALVASLVSWAAAIVGMSQVWYVGPVGKGIRDVRPDIEAWFAAALRWYRFRL